MQTKFDDKARLAAIRESIVAESVSYGEIAELEDIAARHPELFEEDTLLAQWAGIPESKAQTVDVYKGHGLYERKSIQTFKVTFPATITLEIEGVDAKSVTQVLFDAFSPSRGNDPLEGVTITISHGTPFSVPNVATIKTAVIEELADIDVESV